MSTIALIICTIFVLFMLRLDRKQSPEVSFVFWIPTIWFLVLCSKPLAIWFQSSGANIEEGNPLDRAFLIVTLCLGLIIMAKRRFNLSNVIKENIWLFFLLGFMLYSCLWTNVPFISFKRWSRELIAIIMVAMIASEPNPQKAMESLLRRSVYILIPVSYICINYFPEYGRMYIHHSGDLMWVGAALSGHLSEGFKEGISLFPDIKLILKYLSFFFHSGLWVAPIIVPHIQRLPLRL